LENENDVPVGLCVHVQALMRQHCVSSTYGMLHILVYLLRFFREQKTGRRLDQLLEGLVHVSELTRERVRKCEEDSTKSMNSKELTTCQI
jgi:hypothetical protein